jgi:hypothetical protein
LLRDFEDTKTPPVDTMEETIQHLVNVIEQQRMNPGLIALPSERLDRILFAVEQFGENKRFKAVYEALDSEFDYGLLR